MDLWNVGALGMVETQGMTASIVAVDVMAKAAEVTVVGVRRTGAGLVTVSFTGDMASVTAAVESARRAVAAVGGTIVSTVIGRPAVPTEILRAPHPTDLAPPGGDPPGVTPPGDDLPDPAPAAAEPVAAEPAAAEPVTAAPAGAGPKRRPARATAAKRRRPSAAAPPGTPQLPTDPQQPPTDESTDRPREK